MMDGQIRCVTSQTKRFCLKFAFFMPSYGVLGMQLHTLCPQVVTGRLCPAWKAESCPSRLPPPLRRPDVASRLKPCYRCHLVYIVTLEPVSSNLVFSLGRLFFFFFKSAYLCLLLSIFWCLQPKMKGRECFPVADLEGVKGQMFW